MSDSFTHLVRDAVAEMLAKERLSADELATRVAAQYVAEFSREAERLAMASVRRMVKDTLRTFEADEDQAQGTLPLVGLKMPTAIAVRAKDRVYYVLTVDATWTEVLAGLNERDRNVGNAQDKRDLYARGVDRLRPLMQADLALTVAEALAAEAEQVAS